MANEWNKHVMTTYHALKKKNPAVKLGAAMKAAKKTWKKSASPASGGKRKSNRKTRKNRR